MKSIRTRIFAVLILAWICATFAGCGTADRPLTWYQNTLVSADVSDGTHTWRLSPTEDGFTAEIVAPPEAAGVVFHLTDISASVAVEGIVIPATDAMTAGARRLCTLFTLDGERVSDVRADKAAKTVHARFQTDSGEISVVFGADGLPVSFETANGTYTVQSCEIRTE